MYTNEVHTSTTVFRAYITFRGINKHTHTLHALNNLTYFVVSRKMFRGTLRMFVTR